MLLTQADLESVSFAKQTELCFVAFLAKQSLRRSLKQMHISYPSIQKRALGKFWLHCIMLNTVMIPSCHWAVFSDCQWKYSSCCRPPDNVLNFRNGCCIRRVLLRVSITLVFTFTVLCKIVPVYFPKTVSHHIISFIPIFSICWQENTKCHVADKAQWLKIP